MNKLSAFDLVHPAVQLGCFAGILALSMAALHPVFLGISFVAACCFSVYAKGSRMTFRTLAWQIPLVMLIALINPLFSSTGSTELFRVGTQAVYGESLCFGLCMGTLLMNVMLWFSNAAQVLSSDKVMATLGNLLPTVSLMISMVLRLIPQFVNRGKDIDATLQACSAATSQARTPQATAAREVDTPQATAAREVATPQAHSPQVRSTPQARTPHEAPETSREKKLSRVRLVSVLMAWSMEDSLAAADAMRARGWGVATKRTSYKPYRFKARDAVAAVVLIVILGLLVVLVGAALSQYRFYPKMSTLVFWWGYIPYTLFMFLPLALCVADDFRWRRFS